MSESTTIAEFALGLTIADIPNEVQRSGTLHLIDTVGCALAAYALDDATYGVQSVVEAESRGRSSVIGQGRGFSGSQAALANGMLGHALDFDDTHPRSICHISTVVVPAAIAASEAADVNGADLLVACIVGNEVIARIGGAASGLFHARGLHATSVCGVYGAAAVASRIAGLDVDLFVHALGLAGSMASGTFEYLNSGTETKPVHAGMAASAGLVATRLAELGATGPMSTFSGRFGLYGAYLGRPDLDLAIELEDLGQRWETSHISYKMFPACHFVHGAVGSALALLSDAEFSVEDIDRVLVSVPAAAVPLVAEPELEKRVPTSPYQAKFSLQYSIASALVNAELTLDSYGHDALADKRTKQLAQRVDFVSKDFASFPGDFPGGLLVSLRDGRVVEAWMDHAPGSSQSLVHEDEVLAKFRANARLALPLDSVSKLESTLLGIAAESNLESLAGVLRSASSVRTHGGN